MNDARWISWECYLGDDLGDENDSNFDFPNIVCQFLSHSCHSFFSRPHHSATPIRSCHARRSAGCLEKICRRYSVDSFGHSPPSVTLGTRIWTGNQCLASFDDGINAIRLIYATLSFESINHATAPTMHRDRLAANEFLRWRTAFYWAEDFTRIRPKRRQIILGMSIKRSRSVTNQRQTETEALSCFTDDDAL